MNNALAIYAKAQERLRRNIEKMFRELTDYASKENASEKYIDKQNKLIESLTDIYNDYDSAINEIQEYEVILQARYEAHYINGWNDSSNEAFFKNRRIEILFSDETCENLNQIEFLYGEKKAAQALIAFAAKLNEEYPNQYNPPI